MSVKQENSIIKGTNIMIVMIGMINIKSGYT